MWLSLIPANQNIFCIPLTSKSLQLPWSGTTGTKTTKSLKVCSLWLQNKSVLVKFYLMNITKPDQTKTSRAAIYCQDSNCLALLKLLVFSLHSERFICFIGVFPLTKEYYTCPTTIIIIAKAWGEPTTIDWLLKTFQNTSRFQQQHYAQYICTCTPVFT